MPSALATLRSDLRQRVLAAAHHDERIVGVLDYGSSSEGRADALSDLDLALFVQDSAFESFYATWQAWTAQLGPLLLAYVGGVGHPWTVYDATPLPLRVDFAFHRSSALDVVLSWPNAPSSTSAMVLYDATDGRLLANVGQLVGQSLRPADLQQTFESRGGDFWYYWLRTWTTLLRSDLWAARYDYNFMVLGNLVGLLRLEAKAVERWRATSAATAVEQVLSAGRMAQLEACIPERGEAGLRMAFRAAAQLGYDVSAALATTHTWPWPQQLAERVLAITNAR